MSIIINVVRRYRDKDYYSKDIYQNIVSTAKISVVGEVPIGIIDSNNAIFTFANLAVPGTVEIILNGIIQKNGNDYSIAETTITMTSPLEVGDILLINYIKL